MHRVSISFAWPLTVAETRRLLSFGFQVLLLTFLGLVFINTLMPGMVSYSFNPTSLLWPTAIFGLLSGLWPELTKTSAPQRMTWSTWGFVVVMALATGFFVWRSVQGIGWLGPTIAVLSALIVGGLSLLQYDDQDEPDHSDQPRHEK